MTSPQFLKTRVDEPTKARVQELAEAAFLTEASWLKRLVIRELRLSREDETAPLARDGRGAGGEGNRAAEPRVPRARTRAALSSPKSEGSSKLISVRLRPGDHLLLEARAGARGLRPATYVSVLTRAHLRQLAPLPKDELLALRRSIGELAALGRNINQIARAATEGGRLPSSVRDEFRAFLKIAQALRDHTKGLLIANLASWESGHD